MTKRILAPIDARDESEAIVPVVAALARDTGATIRLLRVYPVPERIVGAHGRTVAYVDQEMSRLTAEGLQDLHRIEAELAGVPVEAVVRFGEPAEEIVLEADAFHADLIAVSAGRHGRVRSALAPGIVDQVARATTVPTLALRG